MLCLLSPSKTQNFDSNSLTSDFSNAIFENKAGEINNVLEKLELSEIKKLMKVSDVIANNTKLLIDSFNDVNCAKKQAIFAYTGQVFKGFELEKYKAEDFNFLQKNLIIMSGMYGCVQPFDLIKPYRLEMQAKISVLGSQNLYDFWKNDLTEYINKRNDDFIVNLASNEYFKALDVKKLNSKIITPVFKEKNGDGYKVVAIFAKKARGKMVNFAVKNRISKPDDLHKFNCMGYSFNKALSDDSTLVFTR